jgi:predicted RNA binding protein YcfA (HicA-like mRNA interferase family)
MSNVPSLAPKELAKILLKRGFVLVRIHGSHHYFINPETNKIAVIPMHCKDMPKGTLHAILRQVGIDRNEI